VVLELEEVTLERHDGLEPVDDLDGDLRVRIEHPGERRADDALRVDRLGKHTAELTVFRLRSVWPANGAVERVMHVEPDLRVLEDPPADAIHDVPDRPVGVARDRAPPRELDRLVAMARPERHDERVASLLDRPLVIRGRNRVPRRVAHGNVDALDQLGVGHPEVSQIRAVEQRRDRPGPQDH
jgi:hypothetical protein